MENELRISNIIGPLTFNENAETNPQIISSDQLFFPSHECKCMLCDVVYSLPENQQDLLTHLFFKHRLVIADVDQIASLRDYIIFWKDKFIGYELAEFCTTMLTDKTPEGEFSKNEKYYLLSDVLPQDNQLRRDLQRTRLEKILAHQKMERDDKCYKRECLFCRTVLQDTRAKFLVHLYEKHNFYVAKSENLIFLGELIELLSDKLDNCICIYCEKVFKDRTILKEHMRKKVHKKINPKNKIYDKYFISNYLEMGKNWQSYLKNVGLHKQKQKSVASSCSVTSKKSNRESSSDSDTNWSDWEEKDSLTIICLFCKYSADKYEKITSHMADEHDFNFNEITKSLNFYEKVKIVNFIRRQIHLLRCISCDSLSNNVEELLLHMEQQNHFVMDDSKLWNQPEFYFSTYEDDGLLFCLEDNDDIQDEEALAETLTSTTLNSADANIPEQVAMSVLRD